MRVGIDVSQIAYGNTGVANYLSNLVREMVKNDEHEFILFFSSFRRDLPSEFEDEVKRSNVRIKKFKIPPTALDLLWNRFHIIPIEKFIGNVDIFITSDWSEPPSKCKKATIIYDLIAYKYPEETHNETEFRITKLNISANIVDIQKRKLNWVKKESNIVFCISESSKKDAIAILGIDPEKIKVIYPGISGIRYNV